MKNILRRFQTLGGKHCITGALREIFNYYGFTISEDMIFGLGEGLDFTYINLASSPLVSGRSKIIEFEKVLAQRLGISIQIKQPKLYAKAFDTTIETIDKGHPILVYVDMAYLPYMGLDDSSHFGGHAIVIFGYDDEKQCFYVSDRDNSDYPINSPKGAIREDYHLVNYKQMEQARNSSYRPFPANNKYAVIDTSAPLLVDKEMLMSAISNTCSRLLNPAAKLKGISGIYKFSKEIKKWDKFDDYKLKLAVMTNFFQINRDGGTGGGIFRSMYGGFLVEAAEIIRSEKIARIGIEFQQLADQWDGAADKLLELSKSCNRNILVELSTEIEQLYLSEKILLEQLLSFCCDN